MILVINNDRQNIQQYSDVYKLFTDENEDKALEHIIRCGVKISHPLLRSIEIIPQNVGIRAAYSGEGYDVEIIRLVAE